MNTLFFINLTLARKIHSRQVACFGGIDGMRDDMLLESALGAAQQTWVYTQDIYETAAQYAYSLANNHPALDGNKRTAAACMLVFLVKNGLTPTFTNDLLYNVIIGVATNAIKREELASLLKQHSVTKESS